MAYIRKKTNKGIDYYYIVESYRENGKPKQRVVEYIGSSEKFMKSAIKWYEAVHSVDTKSSLLGDDIAFKAYEHGAEMALFWCAQWIGIESMMDEIFETKTVKGMPRSRVLLLAMIHRAIDPDSKNAFQAWAERTSLPYHLKFDPKDMYSGSFWEAMDGITEDQINHVWNKLITKLMDVFGVDLRCFHLDYSNYYTFIDSKNARCLICVRGHNKQKRDDLRQFSLAVLTASEMLIPIVWNLYEGNKNDKTEFAEFMKRVREELSNLQISPDEVTITFDGGSNSEENFKDIGVHFICAYSLTSHKDKYEIDIADYEEVKLQNGNTRLAHRTDDFTFSGVTGTGILTYSEDLEEGQKAELEKDLLKAKEAAREINERLSNTRSRIFTGLNKAEKDFVREQKEVLEYNQNLQDELDEDKRKGVKRKGRRKKAKPVPVWDKHKVLREMVSNEIYKSRSYLAEFTWVTLVAEPGDSYYITFHVDEAKKAAYIRKYYGKRLTVTDQTGWSTEEILDEYCKQECIENGIFKVSKDTDHFAIRPQFHWTDDKIRTHTFLCLSAIVIAETLRHHIEKDGIIITKAKMLERLCEIHDGFIIVNEKNVMRKVECLDEGHQSLWNSVLKIKEKYVHI